MQPSSKLKENKMCGRKKKKAATPAPAPAPAPTPAAAAASDRIEADVAKNDEVVKKSEKKRDNISEALSERTIKTGTRGGRGRRSLFSSSSGGGFLGRFG